MRHLYMLWTGHLAAVALLAAGVWWLMQNPTGVPEYKMIVILASMTGLILNHIRWWNLSREIDDKGIQDKVDLLVVANYILFILVICLVDFRS